MKKIIVSEEKEEWLNKQMKSVGACIKKKREIAGYTQLEFAKMNGYNSPITVRGLEDGTKDVSLRQLFLYADSLHIDIAELFNQDKKRYYCR